METVASPSSAVSVLLVDDNQPFRHGLQTLISFYNSMGARQFKVVGEAASVEQALKLSTEQKPALILLDLELNQEDGIQFLQRYRALRQGGRDGTREGARVLVLSAHEEDEWVFRAMQAGAKGYVLKQQLSTQLCQAIETVMQDEVYLTPEVATGFFRHFHFCAGQSLKVTPTIHLTEREQEVLTCLVQGDSNDMIAQRLHITVGTVKAYLRGIFEKMEVSSRTQAALKALKQGLVSV